MRIGKGLLAGGAVVVGVLGLLFASGVASGAAGNYAPYGMMSGFYGSSSAATGGLWGMMGRLFGLGARNQGSYPYYGMMGGYAAQGGANKGSAPYYGMMGGYGGQGGSAPYYGMMGGYFSGTGSSTNATTGTVDVATAQRLATQVPSGATLDHASNTITFHGQDVNFAAVAAPSGGPELSFEVAGLVNPTIVVPHGAKVSVQVLNDDTAAPHDFVVSKAVDGAPVFSGAASPELGTASTRSVPSSATRFATTTTGSFVYDCTVPGHAQAGMQGKFIVSQ